MFVKDFKTLFLKGLAALLPTVVTIALLAWVFNWINNRVANPITHLIISFLPDPWENTLTIKEGDALVYGTPIERLDPESGRQLTLEYLTIRHPACESRDQDIKREAQRRRAEAVWQIVFAKYKLNVLGFLIAIVIVYLIGFLLSGLLGRTIWRVVERAVNSVPVIRSLYPNIKQVTDFLLGSQGFDFTGVVAVEYPRRGVWSVGLITGPGMKTIQDSAPGEEMVTIFIPSSPTPVTGYTITVRRKDTVELALSIDEALRFTISGGVIKPPAEGGNPEMAMEEIGDLLKNKLGNSDDS